MPKGQITWITYQGDTRSLTGWASVLHISKQTLSSRLLRGWPPEQAFLPVGATRPRGAARPVSGIAPHIDGPAIAMGGAWRPLALWLHSQEDQDHAL